MATWLDDHEGAPILLLLPPDPEDRVETLKEMIAGLSDEYDEPASKTYAPAFMRAIADLYLIKYAGKGPMPREAYDDITKANSHIASELMHLWGRLQIRVKQGSMALIGLSKTRKLILFELAAWISQTPNEEEFEKICKFFIRVQRMAVDRELEEAMKAALGNDFPVSKAIAFYLQATKSIQMREAVAEPRKPICKVLASAIARSSNDWFFHNAMSMIQPLSNCSEAVHPFMVEQAKRIAEVDRRVKELANELREHHLTPLVKVEYNDPALATVKISVSLLNPYHIGRDIEKERLKMCEEFLGEVKEWRAENEPAIEFEFEIRRTREGSSLPEFSKKMTI